MKGIIKRFKTLRALSHDEKEEGMALASAVMLSAFVFIVVTSLAMTTLVSTELTALNRSTVVTLSSAESGVDDAVLLAATDNCVPSKTDETHGYSYKVYRSAAMTPPISLEDASVSAGCPLPGDRNFIVESSGTDYAGRKTTVVATYRWVDRSENGIGDGAIVGGGGGAGQLGLNNVRITENEGSVLLVRGDLECTNETGVSGDLVILEGDVNLTNKCHIKGSVFATGNITSTDEYHVEGDVYTLGNFFSSNNTTVGGSVYAKGTVQIPNTTSIGGSVIAEGIGTSTIGTGGVVTVGGNVHIGGRFQQFSATVQGNVSAAGGGSNQLFPNTSINGDLNLAGIINTWGDGPGVNGTITENASVSYPSFEIPKQLQPNFFTWIDYSYDPTDWIDAGYTIDKKIGSGACNYQNNASLRAEVNNYTTPTVIDLRDCADPRLYGVTFTLKTDVTIITNGLSNSNALKINSNNGDKRQFNIITPDRVPDNQPTCGVGQSDLGLYALEMGENVEGIIYTPCQVTIGGPPGNINGQVYAGKVNSTGSGVDIKYVKASIPGIDVEYEIIDGMFEENVDQRTVPMLISRVES